MTARILGMKVRVTVWIGCQGPVKGPIGKADDERTTQEWAAICAAPRYGHVNYSKISASDMTDPLLLTGILSQVP